jgi:hypothetical protein
MDVIKEQYYPIGSYDDMYTKWTTLWQERDQEVLEFTNIFHTLHTNMGIKDSERHQMLKYRDGLHRNGISGHLILERGLLICRQNLAEDQTKEVEIWAWEPCTTKARKGWPQPTEKRTYQRWKVSGQPI